MRLRPPDFWQDGDGASHPVARALKPFAGIYRKLGQRRLQNTVPHRSNGPVVCIGNVSMGGVGKTPFSLMVSDILKRRGVNSAFLTRGYGGSEKGPVFVSTSSDAASVGDEALLLFQKGKTCVSRDREAGARAVFADKTSDCLIMDDGFQNPALVKDFSVLLIDAETGFGNGEVFPSGPLRETPEEARRRASVIVFVMPQKSFEIRSDLKNYSGDLPVFHAWLVSDKVPGNSERVVAFCGIGRPEKFYRTVEKSGYHICGRQDFPDHYAYKTGDLEQLAHKAGAADAQLLTTEKDYMRLPTGFRSKVTTLPVTMQLDNETGFAELMLAAIKKNSHE